MALRERERERESARARNSGDGRSKMVMLPEDEDIIVGEDLELEGNDADDNDESEFEVVDTREQSDKQTNLVDAVVGKLEEILIDPGFEEMRMDFCRSHCAVFEDTEENKLEYTELFRAFSDLVEKTLEDNLKAEFPEFTVSWFVDLLLQQKKEDPCEGDVFEMLFNLSDFEEFKQMMLSFKRESETGAAEASDDQVLGQLEVKRMKIHAEEQEDGEQRPDLDFSCLSIRPMAQES